jgi:6-pyruvoyltetrahydropterin/6-carboxytetrahydropterin synthase
MLSALDGMRFVWANLKVGADGTAICRRYNPAASSAASHGHFATIRAIPTMRITRRLEFDAGHRIPNHLSQCRHLHGHRYALEVTLSGGVINAAERPDDGMVMDFSEVKAIAKRHVVDLWDHAFLVWCQDLSVVGFLAGLPDHKTVVLDRVPTAENLAGLAFAILDPLYRDSYGNHLQLERVRLYETPNCWADADRP